MIVKTNLSVLFWNSQPEEPRGYAVLTWQLAGGRDAPLSLSPSLSLSLPLSVHPGSHCLRLSLLEDKLNLALVFRCLSPPVRHIQRLGPQPVPVDTLLCLRFLVQHCRGMDRWRGGVWTERRLTQRRLCCGADGGRSSGGGGLITPLRHRDQLPGTVDSTSQQQFDPSSPSEILDCSSRFGG